MTVLLGYTVFLLIMNDLLPNNAGKTPIIESDPSEESKLVSSPGAQSSQLIQNLLTSLSRDILVIRSHLDYHSLHEHKQEEWIRVTFIWEGFFLRLYLLLPVVFSIILISSWCMWYKTWTQGLTGVLLQKPFMDSSMVRDTGSSSMSGEEKVASDLTAKLLLLDKLVSLGNDVMETKRKRSFPGFGTPLDRLSLSTMEMKGKQRKVVDLPKRRFGVPIDRLGMNRMANGRG
ncbi:Osteocrin [Acipenser ruthenus]|uniref:Osteocrin n=1 Tax=Acipenser ruthenus TaxID=7906 RepID=A0A444UHL8_ACIRT|nr:Osteocrin [Acipenser ruthenus]